MNITPNTNIKILKGVPIDNTYDHTLYFDSQLEQASYFATKMKYNLTNYTYQRVNINTMKVKMCADDLYDCNYLMFQNTAFGSKWFYAFINEVNYINNDVSEIVYELDVIQTWFFDYNFEKCFVERMHPRTDYGYWNTQPEPVEVGEYVFINQAELKKENLCIYVMITPMTIPGTSQQILDGGVYDDVYSGSALFAFKNTSTGKATLDNLLSALDSGGQGDKVNAIYMGEMIDNLPWSQDDMAQVPTGRKGNYAMIQGTVANNLSIPWNNGELIPNLPLGSEDVNSTSAYVPKNRKLYTYPYNFACVYTGNGDSMNLRYEFGTSGNHIHSGTIDLQFLSNLLPPIQSVVMPINYKGITRTNYEGEPIESDYNFGLLTERVSIDSYPLCSWNYNTYKNWLARDLFPSILSGVANIGASGLGMVGNTTDLQNLRSGLGMGGSLISNVGAVLGSAYRASVANNVTRGNVNTTGALKPHNGLTYFCSRVTVTAEQAKVIDDFFTMFGYAINECFEPSRKTREAFTYIKTRGCHIDSKTLGNVGFGIPSDAIKQICKIHDNGITYWCNHEEVGNYNTSNRPLGELPTT